MSRKSSASVVTFNLFQVAPPSVVRSTVAPDPLAHATRSLTALTPRKRAFTPLVCNTQCGTKSSPTLSKTSPYFIRVIRCLSRSSQARIQLRRRREPAIAIRLSLARGHLVTRILRLVLARRHHFPIRTNLTRTARLHARLQRARRLACAQIKLSYLQHHRSSRWPTNRRMIAADEYAVRRSHRLRCFAQQVLRRARATEIDARHVAALRGVELRFVM